LRASVSGFAQGGNGQSGNQGAQLYGTNCVVCHGSDGSGTKGTSIITPNYVAMSDADLTKAVHDGTAAGMPPFPQLGDANIGALVRNMRKLQGRATPLSRPR